MTYSDNDTEYSLRYDIFDSDGNLTKEIINYYYNYNDRPSYSRDLLFYIMGGLAFLLNFLVFKYLFK